MTISEFVRAKITQGGQESRWGYHFIETFNANKRKFFLRYVLGLQAKAESPSQVMGTAVHAALEAVHTSDLDREGLDLPKTMVSVAGALIEAKRPQFASQIECDTRKKTAEAMAYAWANTFGEPADNPHYAPFAAELGLEIELEDGFPFSCTIDRVQQHRTSGGLTLIETKTTGWSDYKMRESIERGDQVTAYLMALNKAVAKAKVQGELPAHVKCVGAIAEVLYRNGKSPNGPAKALQGELIVRTEGALWAYEQKLMGLYADLEHRLRAWQADPSLDYLHYLWPANHSDTEMFGDEYYPLADLGLDDLTNPQVLSGYGFSINPKRSETINAFLATRALCAQA